MKVIDKIVFEWMKSKIINKRINDVIITYKSGKEPMVEVK